jgi:hypothetical protein
LLSPLALPLSEADLAERHRIVIVVDRIGASAIVEQCGTVVFLTTSNPIGRSKVSSSLLPFDA